MTSMKIIMNGNENENVYENALGSDDDNKKDKNEI